MEPGHFSLAATFLEPQQIPMFYIFPLEFGDIGYIHISE